MRMFGPRCASAAATAVIAACAFVLLAAAPPAHALTGSGAGPLPSRTRWGGWRGALPGGALDDLAAMLAWSRPRRMLVQDAGRASPDIPVAPSASAQQQQGSQQQGSQQQQQQLAFQGQQQKQGSQQKAPLAVQHQQQQQLQQGAQQPPTQPLLPAERRLPVQLPAHVYLISFVLLLSIMLLLLSCHCWRLCRMAQRMEAAGLAAHLPTGAGHPYLPAKRSTPEAVIDALPVLRYRDVAGGGAASAAAAIEGDDAHRQQQQQRQQQQAVPADEEEPCAVCYEDFDGDDEVKQLPCGHVFHPECIKSWLRIDYTCPVCRTCVWPPFSVGGTDSLGRALALQMSVRDGTAAATAAGDEAAAAAEDGAARAGSVTGGQQHPPRAARRAAIDAVLATVGLARAHGGTPTRRGPRGDRPRRSPRQRGPAAAPAAATAAAREAPNAETAAVAAAAPRPVQPTSTA